MLSEAGNTVQTTKTEVIAALRQASAATGSDFNYLLNTAMRESGLNPEAKATTSSATGLFQFVQQTWLGMVKQYGAKFGLGSYADAISRNAEGHYTVDNQSDRAAILSLRNDPKVSALMAGEYAVTTQQELQARLGRPASAGDLYAAHFLGTGAACRLIEMAQSAPHSNAAQCFPVAAESNRSVFFNADGSAKTIAQVYDWACKQQPHGSTAALKVAAAPSAASAPPIVNGISAATQAFFAQTSQASDLSTLGLFGDAAKPMVPNSPLPQPPFVLTPGVMNVLASLDPAKAASVKKTS